MILPASEAPGGGQHGPARAAMDASGGAGYTATRLSPERGAPCNHLDSRVPCTAVSPCAKPPCVSHTVGDHTSLLALSAKRCVHTQPLTRRDAYADTLEDLVDVSGAPTTAQPVRFADAGDTPRPADRRACWAARSAARSSTVPGLPRPLGAGSAPGPPPQMLAVPASRPDSHGRP
jgi:hypothetical protein